MSAHRAATLVFGMHGPSLNLDPVVLFLPLACLYRNDSPLCFVGLGHVLLLAGDLEAVAGGSHGNSETSARVPTSGEIHRLYKRLLRRSSPFLPSSPPTPVRDQQWCYDVVFDEAALLPWWLALRFPALDLL